MNEDARVRRQVARHPRPLEQAFETSRLPESPSAQAALHDLLVRVRMDEGR